MKRAIDIEKRMKIAEAVEHDPALTYLALQQRFKTSTRVVADALRRPSVEWRAMLDGNSVTGEHGWQFLGITVRGRVRDGDVDYETQEQGCADWEASGAATIAELLEGLGHHGWMPISITTINHGELPFSGTFELILKQVHRYEWPLTELLVKD